MTEIRSQYSRIKRVTQLQASIAPTYLVLDEDTGLYGVQNSMGGFKIAPDYSLDEDYDFIQTQYDMAGIDHNGKMFLVETDS